MAPRTKKNRGAKVESLDLARDLRKIDQKFAEQKRLYKDGPLPSVDEIVLQLWPDNFETRIDDTKEHLRLIRLRIRKAAENYQRKVRINSRHLPNGRRAVWAELEKTPEEERMAEVRMHSRMALHLDRMYPSDT